MKSVEIGQYFEGKAKAELERLGYEIIEHCSRNGAFAPYDILVKKDKKVYAVEVKGRSGEDKEFFIKEDQLLNYMFMENVLIFLINDIGYRLLSLEDWDNSKKLNGFKLRLGMEYEKLALFRDEFKRLHEKYRIREKKGFEYKLLWKLGNRYILVFDEEELKQRKINIKKPIAIPFIFNPKGR